MISNDINMLNFESDFTFSKRRKCGEIFLSGNKILLICKYCDSSTESIEKFQEHIFRNHFAVCNQESLDDHENIGELNQQENNCLISKKCESKITPICAKRRSPNLFQINYKKFHQKRSEINNKMFERTKQPDLFYNSNQEAIFLDNETEIDEKSSGTISIDKNIVCDTIENAKTNDESQYDTKYEYNPFNASNEKFSKSYNKTNQLNELQFLSQSNTNTKSRQDSLYLDDQEMLECKDDSFNSGLLYKDKDFLDLEIESNVSESSNFSYSILCPKNYGEMQRLETLYHNSNEKTFENCNI